MDEGQAAGAFSAADAAATLDRLEAYEETLTARAFGMTMMAFGIAGPATSMTYAYAAEHIARAGYGWTLSFLWIPWILSAAILSATLWKTHAITLQQTGKKEGSWLWFVLFSLAYIAILSGIWWLTDQDYLRLGEGNQNLLTLGIFTIGLASFFRWRFGPTWMLRVMYGVAAVLIALAFAYAALDLPSVAETLVAAVTSLAAWVGAGLYIAMRG